MLRIPTVYAEQSYMPCIPTARTHCVYLSVSALGLEPRRFEALDFKSSVSNNSTIRTDSHELPVKTGSLFGTQATHTRELGLGRAQLTYGLASSSCGGLGMPFTLCIDAQLLSNSQNTIDPLSYIDKESVLTLVESFLSVLQDSSTLSLAFPQETSYLTSDAIIDVVLQSVDSAESFVPH